jgi:hypothetical protein
LTGVPIISIILLSDEVRKKERTKTMTESIRLLADKLTIANIPFEITDDVMDNKNNQIWYPSYEDVVYDVICHEYSYGGKDGLLEIMRWIDGDFDEDNVDGYLTVEDVFARIYTHYNNN